VDYRSEASQAKPDSPTSRARSSGAPGMNLHALHGRPLRSAGTGSGIRTLYPAIGVSAKTHHSVPTARICRAGGTGIAAVALSVAVDRCGRTIDGRHWLPCVTIPHAQPDGR